LEPWIQTRSGKKFTPLSPKQEDITIQDIAWALSMIPRYCGHTIYHYSVAYHSFLVSFYVPPRYALEGLLHDASEAYLNDIPRPVKHNFRLNGYCEIEDIVSAAIAKKFNLQYPYPDCVKEIDTRILVNEKRDLFTVNYDWGLEYDPIENLKIVAMDQWTVYHMFLNRFHELVKERI
jgi:hypothetical protein